jgi:hypothetical protein
MFGEGSDGMFVYFWRAIVGRGQGELFKKSSNLRNRDLGPGRLFSDSELYRGFREMPLGRSFYLDTEDMNWVDSAADSLSRAD